jgi:hypothetical protein
LQSPKLSISHADDFEAEGSLDASQVSEYAQGKLVGDYKNQQDYMIQHEGEEPLVFAVKTAKVYFKNSKYRLKFAPLEVRKDQNQEVSYFDEDSEIVLE